MGASKKATKRFRWRNPFMWWFALEFWTLVDFNYVIASINTLPRLVSELERNLSVEWHYNIVINSMNDESEWFKFVVK